MNPAYSVIFFTVATGAGYGLVILIAGIAALGITAPDRGFALAGFALSFGAITFGLLSSTFHLGHPERAWRALGQWRTSWLSREGVLAVLAYLPLGLFAWGWVMMEQNTGLWAAAGVIGATLALGTVWCTGMIYASLAAIPAWYSRLTAPCYVVLALATGSLWLVVLARLFPGAGVDRPAVTHLPLALLILAWIIKAAYWAEADRKRANPAHSPESATGLGGATQQVRLLDAPHTGENFVMKEMGFEIARRHATKMRRVAQLFAFIVPLALTESVMFLPQAGANTLTLIAFGAALFGTLGVLVERWLFFAEARHVSMHYYGRR